MLELDLLEPDGELTLSLDARWLDLDGEALEVRSEADDGGSELDACEALDGDVEDRLSLDWLDSLDPLGDPDFDGELRLEAGELGVEPDEFEGELALLRLSLDRE